MTASPQAKADYGKRRSEAQRQRKEKRRNVLGRLESLLNDNGIDIEDVGQIEKIRVNEWEVVTKDVTGEAHITPAHAASIVINPAWAEGPKWPLVQPAQPITVNVPPSKGPALLKGWKTALVEPDPQIGFLVVKGVLHPIHDPRALDVSEQIAEAERPNNWINLGDYLDLAEMGNYRQEPGFFDSVQPAVDEGHRHAAVMTSMTSKANDDDDWIHEGNHDQRMASYILDNARAAFNLRKATQTPESWPVLSVPSLCEFDSLGVKYVDGYPATWRYINERCATTHGTYTGADFLRKYAEAEQVSVICGHDHSAGTYYKTRNTRDHKVTTFAHSPGTLARIDGFVPGGGKYRGRRVDGMPTRSWQDWQQGITLVRYVPGDGPVKLEHIEIDEGEAVHRGQRFVSKVKLSDKRT